MFNYVVKKVFGTANNRALKKYRAKVEKINALESDIQKLTDEELKNKTLEFKERLSNGESLDDILVEALLLLVKVQREF